MKIAIINYGMCNLGSVRRAFEDIGAETLIVNHPSQLYGVDRIVLPGVGAFTEGMSCLNDGGWKPALHELVMLQHKPLLGICLGMQMLASYGVEGGLSEGLDLIPGKVQRLDELGCNLRIPHVGWNEVHFEKQDLFFENIPNTSDFYFVHSYAFDVEDRNNLIATVPYGLNIAAVIRKDHVFGCQFHPEKSSKAGRQILKNFMQYPSC